MELCDRPRAQNDIRGGVGADTTTMVLAFDLLTAQKSEGRKKYSLSAEESCYPTPANAAVMGDRLLPALLANASSSSYGSRSKRLRTTK